MGSPAPVVSETILVKGSTLKAVAQRVTLAMTQTEEYRHIDTEPGKLVFERSYRTALGMVTKRETCYIMLADGQQGITVNLFGQCLPDQVVAVRAAALGRSVAGAQLFDRLGAVEVMPKISEDFGVSDPEPPPLPVDGWSTSPPAKQPAPTKASGPEAHGASTPSEVPPRPSSSIGESMSMPKRAPGPIAPMPGSSSGPGPASAESKSLVLQIGSSAEFQIDCRLVIGRFPRLEAVPPQGVNETLSAKTVVVDDQTLSRTHCWIEPSKDGVLVCDLHSTNGVSVVNPQGRVVVLDSGIPVYIEPPADLRFGDVSAMVIRS